MPTTAVRFTKPEIKKLTCPAGKAEVFFWDSVLPGFGLRAYASGRRQWVAQYRDSTGRTRRASFGDVKTVELDEAREAARSVLAKAELGADPQAEKKAARQAARIGALIEAYLADAQGRLKPRSYVEVKRHLNTHAKPLHHEAASAVGRAEVVKLLAGITKAGGPVAANRVRSSLSAMWVWGLRTGMIEGENPVAYVPKPAAEAPRERTLTDAELALIWAATGEDHDHDRIVRLIMLTGARREEVAGMAWDEIEAQLWTLPRARSKNGLPHEVPLGPLALAQLPARREKRPQADAGEASAPGRAKREMRPLVFGRSEDEGFSGWSRCKERLDARIKKSRAEAFEEAHGRKPTADEVPPMAWTLHDLRRTLSTWMNENGVEPHIVEAVLNHASGAAKRGVAGVYNKAQYREPKRAAMALWEAHVRKVAGLPAVATGNVAQFAKAG
jgi:integrase